MRWGFAIAIALAGGCQSGGTFECTSNAACEVDGVQGVCEANGYCSFPDDGCPSGRRYGEHAPSGIAGMCVPVDAAGTGTTGDGATTGVETTGTGPSLTSSVDESSGGDTLLPESSGDTDDSGGSTTGPANQCIDEDGDGFGIGAGCLGPDCDDLNGAHNDACVYISPDGDDGGRGTLESPFLTFERALADVTIGSSLILLDGEYTVSTTELPDIHCGDNAPGGSPALPIVLRALNEREALLRSDGSMRALHLLDCGYWRVWGLAAEGADLLLADGGSQGPLIEFERSTNLEVRRMLARTPNRARRVPVVTVRDCDAVLLEDTEVYDFISSGFSIDESTNINLRRCYAASRGYPDAPACVASAPTDADFHCSLIPGRGDAGFLTDDSNDVIIENSISVGNARGYRLRSGQHNGTAAPAGLNNVVVGSISYQDTRGVQLSSEIADKIFYPLAEARILDTAILMPSNRGLDLQSAVDTELRGLTVFGAGNSGIDVQIVNDCAPDCGVDIRDTLIMQGAQLGFEVGPLTNTSIAYCNATGNAMPDYDVMESIDDMSGIVQNSLSIEVPEVGTAQGQCLVYVPDTADIYSFGEDAAPIGATVVERYEGGQPTRVPLWDPQTGGFPCGAVVAGFNDGDLTCAQIHSDLRVGVGDCPIPMP